LALTSDRGYVIEYARRMGDASDSASDERGFLCGPTSAVSRRAPSVRARLGSASARRLASRAAKFSENAIFFALF
jgi:hypothetical protein